MTSPLIPSGRTSLVTHGDIDYQLQTEYAARPHPRVTTTIFASGAVLHKIERLLPQPVETIEEMHQVEEIIKTQHLEVTRVIRDQGVPAPPEKTAEKRPPMTRLEQIRALAAVERVYLVTAEGKLVGDTAVTGEFKKMFKPVLRELPEILTVFAELPGPGTRREEGLYEIEPGRILLASTGIEFYLILLKPDTPFDNLAERIKTILRA